MSLQSNSNIGEVYESQLAGCPKIKLYLKKYMGYVKEPLSQLYKITMS